MHVSLCVPMSQWEHLQGQPGVYTSAMDTRLRVPKPQKYISRQAGYCQELMSRPKGGNERPTSHYSVPFMELFSSGEFPSVVAA